jgi:putative resolvase
MSTTTVAERSSFVRLHVAASHCHVSTSTIRRLCNSGLVACHRTPVGHHRTVNLAEVCEVIGVAAPTENQSTENSESEGGRVILIYARVSTHKQKVDGNLARQVDRLRAYCAEHWPGAKVVVISEVGSGLSDQRKGFLRMVELLAAGRVQTLVCEFRDRIARFGVGVVQQLCQAKGTQFLETRTGTDEQQLTDEQEMARDVMAIMACYSNRAAAKRGGATVKIVPPSGFKERVAQLAGSGLSRRDICAQIAADRPEWTCQNTGKKIGERPVRKILESLPATVLVPATVKSFIRKRCAVGVAKRESTAALYAAYVVHCNTLHAKPLTQDKWLTYVKESVGPTCRVENGKVSVAYGLTLKASA